MALTMINDNNAGVAQTLQNGLQQDVRLDLIDPATRYCRMPIDTQSKRFQGLMSSIGSQGQISPVILRPSQTKQGRFETVAGHRRIAALSILAMGSTVRAVVADLDDYQALLLAGMDNTTNQALSYAEKVWHSLALDTFSWSNNLEDKERLSIDALSLRPGELSRFREIRRTVALDVLEAIGPAYEIGKDLWWSFTTTLADDRLNLLERLRTEIAAPDFQNMPTKQRFDRARGIIGLGKIQHRSITVDGKEALLGNITERKGKVSLNVGTLGIGQLIQRDMPVYREREINAKFDAYVVELLAGAKAGFDAIEAVVQKNEQLPV